MEVHYVYLLAGALGGTNIRPKVRPCKNPEPLRSTGEGRLGLQRIMYWNPSGWGGKNLGIMYWNPSGWEGENLGRIMF